LNSRAIRHSGGLSWVLAPGVSGYEKRRAETLRRSRTSPRTKKSAVQTWKNADGSLEAKTLKIGPVKEKKSEEARSPGLHL